MKTQHYRRNGITAKAVYVNYVPGLGFGCWAAYGGDNRLGYYKGFFAADARCLDWLETGR